MLALPAYVSKGKDVSLGWSFDAAHAVLASVSVF